MRALSAVTARAKKFAATTETMIARVKSHVRSTYSAEFRIRETRGQRTCRGPRPYRVVVIRPSRKKLRFHAGFGYISQN